MNPLRAFSTAYPVLLLLVLTAFCGLSRKHKANAANKAGNDFPYALETPDNRVVLPQPGLHEISALSPTNDPNILLCISDEIGEFYLINAQTGATIRRVLFRDHGDFEGTEMVHDTLYALKSDGKIFEIAPTLDSTASSREYQTSLSKENDMEGLCYDAKRNALLLACKENPESNKPRNIYAFDLALKQLAPQAVYTIDPDEVARLAPTRIDEKAHFFSPSGIAIHPISGDVYVLSTAKKRLVVLDYQTGNIKYVQYLTKSVIPQPEGIAFDPKGNLFISSEGRSGDAFLLQYHYQKSK